MREISRGAYAFDGDSTPEFMTSIRQHLAEGRAILAAMDACYKWSGKDQFERWAMKTEGDMDSEMKCRASVVCEAERIAGPLCDAIQDRDDAQRQMAAERRNPSGVVNLATLHDLGERIQIDDATIGNLKARYASKVHRAFNGVCPK
jgi:hypothetical protein